MQIDIEIKDATEEEARNIRCLAINYLRFYNPKERGIRDEVRIKPILNSVSKVDGYPFARRCFVKEWGIMYEGGGIVEMHDRNDEYLMDIASKYKRVELVLEDEVSYNPVVDTLWFSWPVTEWKTSKKRYSW